MKLILVSSVLALALSGPRAVRSAPVLDDPLKGSTTGTRSGGMFVAGGWQVTGKDDAIVSNVKAWDLAKSAGCVRLRGHSLCDDNGPLLGLGVSYFQALRHAKYDRQRLHDSLALLAAKGFNYVRILSMVSWDGLEPDVLAVRTLKTLGELSKKSVELVADGEMTGGRKGKPHGLRTRIPAGRGFEENTRPAPSTAPIAYSDQEKEGLALRVLQQAINGDAAELQDYHHLRGVGADALDRLQRYFEVKASYGAMPEEVTLTANEVERALREGKDFFLAVIAGLEQGYETVVRIISNPLRELRVKPKTSVTLTGIGKSKVAIEVRFSEKPR